MHILRHGGWRLWPVTFVAALAFACGNSEDSGNSQVEQPAVGGTGGTDPTATGGAELPPATGGMLLRPNEGCGPCPDGTFCSISNQCLPAGTCVSDEDCGGGKVCDETNTCVTGGSCGTSEFDLSSVPPNLLFVLDRSCSMTQSRTTMGDDVALQKWVPVVDALVQVVTDLGGDIQFGLELFPDGLDPESECGQNPTGEIAVPLSPEGGARITELLLAARTDEANPIYPSNGPCQTNTYSALSQAAAQAALADPERKSYVILLTDGEPYCGDFNRRNETSDTAINGVISDMAASGIPTFVIGFGDVADVDPEALARYAISGGTTPSPEQPYYDAANGEQLLADLREITKGIVSCDYALDSTPPGEELYVFFDNENQIQRDPTHAEGWDFNPETLTLSFFGTACELLQNDQVVDIDVVYGCARPVLE